MKKKISISVICGIILLQLLFQTTLNAQAQTSTPTPTPGGTSTPTPTPPPPAANLNLTLSESAIIYGDPGIDTMTHTTDGNNTPRVTIEADFNTRCPGFECAFTTTHFILLNDTGAVQVVNMCYVATFENAPYPGDVGITGQPRYPLPHMECQSGTININDTINMYINMGLTGGAQAYGEKIHSGFSYHIEIVLTYSPITDCTDNMLPVSSSILDIDPIIEMPLGPVGDPADDQIFETIEGHNYQVSIAGSWNDGTTERADDVAISWDGTTWTQLKSAPAMCVDSNGYVLTAESDTFHLRVNDTAAAFADNTATDPFTYSIGEVRVDTACESQYTYDSYDDLVGFTGVTPTASNGVIANNAAEPMEPLVIGDWYVVRWNYGAWQDDDGPDRKDLEYSWSFYGGFEDLAEGGGSSVWCVSTDGTEVLIQANADNLYLRVNDQNMDFSDNSGLPFYDLFHVTFIRTPESCELQYQVADLLEHGIVNADQSGGKRFAFTTTRPDQSTWGLPDGVEFGGWYTLDTTDGPWNALTLTGYDEEGYNYEMDVSEDGGSTWVALADWTHPVCNFALDTQGHRRVVFQLPFDGTVDWKLRVSDTALFVGNLGSMEWDLYGTIALASVPEEANGQCDYSYDEGSPVDLGEIAGNDADGEPLTGLVAGDIYVLKIIGDGYGWYEDLVGGDPLFDVEFSQDGGGTYVDLPDGYDGKLCAHTLGEDLYVFFQAGSNYQYSLRVNSETFPSNRGSMGYAIYPSTPGQTLVNTCFDGSSLQAITEFDWVGSLGLGPRDEAGDLLLSNNARYTEYVALTVGASYAIEVPVSHERWTDGTSSAGRSDVAISNDNGVTWYQLNMDTEIIDCASRELIGDVYKAKFTVQEGEVWKVRVNDTAGAFADNGGSIAYKFYVLCDGMACTGSIPNDSTTNSIPAISIQGGGDVCTLPVMRPSPLSAAELFSVGNYFGSWVQYINLSVLRYMAWCPKHTETFFSFLNRFRSLEPMATIIEFQDALGRVQEELESYDWGGGNSWSLFDVQSKAELNNLINSRFFPSGNNSVWDGGSLISFGQGTGLPDAYYACSTSFTERLPSRLKDGVCFFVSAYFKEISASFWIQIVLDIGVLFMLLGMLKGALQETVYMMTGVKPWTKSGINSSVDKLAANMERRDRADEVDRELSQKFGGSYSRNSDGSYPRRD